MYSDGRNGERQKLTSGAFFVSWLQNPFGDVRKASLKVLQHFDSFLDCLSERTSNQERSDQIQYDKDEDTATKP